jgi:GcrA cell cycle regulator
MIQFWTVERVGDLKWFQAAGLTGSQIAELIGDGCTRNMVIGKLYRLGIPGMPDSEKRLLQEQIQREFT